MIGWLRKMFTTKYTALKRETDELKVAVADVRHEAKQSEEKLKTTLDERNDEHRRKYRPSPLARGFGWNRDDPNI